MIDMAQVTYVDVCDTYFDISVDAIEKYACIFDDEDGFRVIMNQVISKPYAIEKAFSIYQSQKNEFTNLFVSCDAMKVKQIIDYSGRRIFAGTDENLSGWLFFFDLVPFANWEHPCKYLLIIDEEMYIEVDYNRGLSETVLVEKLY